eukprot:scaffold401030_cov36-Prasinocladus_malaysianus.AAC.2
MQQYLLVLHPVQELEVEGVEVGLLGRPLDHHVVGKPRHVLLRDLLLYLLGLLLDVDRRDIVDQEMNLVLYGLLWLREVLPLLGRLLQRLSIDGGRKGRRSAGSARQRPRQVADGRQGSAGRGGSRRASSGGRWCRWHCDGGR